MSLTVEQILTDLTRDPPTGQPAPSVLSLLARYDPESPAWKDAWDNDPHGPRLYRWFTGKLIDLGSLTRALKLARRRLDAEARPGLKPHERAKEGDPVLRYLAALAFARGRSRGSAARFATPLVEQLSAAGWAPPPGLDGPDGPDKFRVDVLSLAARLRKDEARRFPPGPARARLAGEAADLYLRAAKVGAVPWYPTGNAATLRFVEGKVDEAVRLAGEVRPQAEAAAAADPGDYWPRATAGEMCLVQGQEDAAREWYRQAVQLMLGGLNWGAVSALLPNIDLLVEAGAHFNSDWIAGQIGGVVVLSGHRVDARWAATPRFPNDPVLIEKVDRALRDALDHMDARFGFCSLACGSDLLFARAMKDRGADLQVVLPFAKPDFCRLSVDYGRTDRAWRPWANLFQEIINWLDDHRPDALYYATNEPYLGSDRLFGYANEILQGMAIVRGGQLGVDPTALIVLDPAAEPKPGGAAHFRELWEAGWRAAEVIDLAALRGWVPDRPPEPAPAPDRQPDLARPVRAMAFADVAGFSRMREENTPDFFKRFQAILADTLAAAGDWVLLKNTWGDGVFVVFGEPQEPAATDCPACGRPLDRPASDGPATSADARPATAPRRTVTATGEAMATGVAAAAEFALRLVAAFAAAGDEWQRMEFADPNPIRVGLHVGPVFELAPDPVLGRANYFGQHVNRTARIEPVTLPGSAYASEQFAALLTVAAPRRFECEFVGVEALAKDYATVPLYRIARPGPHA
jgi:adenylate cyclase